MADEEVTPADEGEAPPRGHNRQPIVSVLGHVDHGKTSVLDMVRSIGSQRQASVMDREAGGITQHIGATEVPADVLNETCAAMLGGKNFKSPGLLFIDTPGHHSFASLRNRGGSVADIAVLVVDIMEGLQPQTIESLNILKETRTPFVIAGNKIDRLHGWRSERPTPPKTCLSWRFSFSTIFSQLFLPCRMLGYFSYLSGMVFLVVCFVFLENCIG